MKESTTSSYTPALGRHDLTGDYDRVIAIMTRERKWRSLVLRQLDPKNGETIVDIGSGTGSLAILTKQAAHHAHVIAVDPDPAVKAIAKRKAQAAGVKIRFETALGGDAGALLGKGIADKLVSSLVLHQCPWEAKIALLQSAFDLLKPGGRILIADYGEQHGLLMQLLFNQVRQLDGYENTQVNKDGLIPQMISYAGFANVREHSWVCTPTGSISLYTGEKPA